MRDVTFDIMFSDLKPEVQQALATELGYDTPEECLRETNWDVIPLAIYEQYADDGDDDDDEEEEE